jgi:putative ABC transport system ATP-binding protein
MPGAPIITQGDSADRFYIITKGQVEICLYNPGGRDMVVTSLEAGQYFGEIGLLHGSPRIASVRAAGDTAVQVATIDRATFGDLVGDSELTRQAITRVADQRTTENVAAREREVYYA